MAFPSANRKLEELEEMEESEREQLEAMLEAVTLAGSAEQVRAEVQELRRLAAQAQLVEDAGSEAKLSELKDLLQKEGFFDHPDQRLLLFTEFKDTLDYLVARLRSWGFRVGCIHGGMKPGSRDEKGTRLHAEQQFREGEIQVLVATEAAGEGINLQVCNILFNYDIPWNPNRLEQRMGRIHRYGQRKDCLIFNFVATNTIEGRVLQRLLEKLQEIRDALEDDAVFNVVGEVLPAAHVERVLRDYYAGRLGETDLEERLLRDVDEGQFRAICQNALEGLASKKLNLEMLIERRARAQERRVVPETIARFLREAAEFVPLALKTVPSSPHTFEPARTPSVLRRYETDPDWKLPALADRYPRCSTDREAAETEKLEWVTPGHPLFEAIGGTLTRRLSVSLGRVRPSTRSSTSDRRASTSTGRALWMGSGRSSTSDSSPWRFPRTVNHDSRSPACSVTSRLPAPRPRCPRSRPSPRRRPGSTSTRSSARRRSVPIST
jgi:superfamily II DNA/RNA helicase